MKLIKFLLIIVILNIYSSFSFGNFFKNTVNKVGDAFKNAGNKIKEKTVEWTKDGINGSKQAIHKLE